MKHKIYLLLPLLLLTLTVSAQNWQIVWQDEFTNGISPDWVFETGTGSGGWGNNELQYYRRENASVSNGQLVIQARREAFGGMQYTSARMKTQGRRSWKYGKIEARIAMPSFQGVWPAFWMLGDAISSVGWPSCGEIDVMEHVNTGGTVHGTIHWQDHNNTYANYGGSTSTSITSFHNYTVEWDASLIKWFVDGVKYHEASIANGVNGTSEFHNNFFILLNLAIGGNWPGFVVDNNAFPANMLVDYVRVYQNTGGPSGPGIVYQDCNYGGAGIGLQVGDYNLAAMNSRGIANDWISSVRVQAGYRVTLYENDNFTGASIALTADNSCLVGAGWNDRATSMRVATNNPGFSTTIQAENWVSMAGVQTEACSEGGLNVGWIDPGDWMAYSVTIPTTGTYRVIYRVASPNAGRTLRLEKDNGATQLGSVTIPNTGGWQNWTNVAHNVTLPAGTYTIGIATATGGFNLNYLTVTNNLSARMSTEGDFVNAEEDFSSMLSPNPVNDLLFIKDSEKVKQIKIYNIQGQEMINVERPGSSISVQALNPGVHVAFIERLDNTLVTGKLVKR